MVAGKEELLLIQQRHAARRMTRDRNDLKLRHDVYAVSSVNDPFSVRNRLGISAMDNSLRPKVAGILVRIGHVVFVRQKDIGDPTLLFEGLDEMVEIAR